MSCVNILSLCVSERKVPLWLLMKCQALWAYLILNTVVFIYKQESILV